MTSRRLPKGMTTEQWQAARAACPCICHDMMGGPAHPNQRCQCGGGEGMDA